MSEQLCTADNVHSTLGSHAQAAQLANSLQAADDVRVLLPSLEVSPFDLLKPAAEVVDKSRCGRPLSVFKPPAPRFTQAKTVNAASSLKHSSEGRVCAGGIIAVTTHKLCTKRIMHKP
jgi:hypothetical protein